MQRKEFEKKDKPQDASRLKVGIVVADFNEDITSALHKDALETLLKWNMQESNIFEAHTYGSFELPFACKRLIETHDLDAVIAIGCIIKGETMHDEYLANATMQGLMRVGLDANVPVGLAVLTTKNLAQARARSKGNTNHGGHAAIAALRVALMQS